MRKRKQTKTNSAFSKCRTSSSGNSTTGSGVGGTIGSGSCGGVAGLAGRLPRIRGPDLGISRSSFKKSNSRNTRFWKQVTSAH